METETDPRFTLDRQTALAKLIEAGGSEGKSARDAFILENRGLVYSRVLKLTANLWDARRLARFRAGIATDVPVTEDRDALIEELVAEGTVALIVAVDRFDWRRKIKFSTFAVPHIDGALKRRFTQDKRRLRAEKEYQDAT